MTSAFAYDRMFMNMHEDILNADAQCHTICILRDRPSKSNSITYL